MSSIFAQLVVAAHYVVVFVLAIIVECSCLATTVVILSSSQ